MRRVRLGIPVLVALFAAVLWTATAPAQEDLAGAEEGLLLYVGQPPIDIEPPRLALQDVAAPITVRATGELLASDTRVEILDSTGATRATGVLPLGGEVTLEIVASASGNPYSVRLEKYPDSVPFSVRVISGWLSVLPPLLAILLALIFRQVVPALLAGVWIGASVVHAGGIVGALRLMDQYMVQSLADTDHASIIIFSLLLGGMVGVVSRSGGTIGLVEALSPYATSSRRGQLVTWFMGLVVFFDDYANTLLVGNTMRPVTDRLKVSREKLAYIVDSTAAPVASIALVSTWIGYEVSLIGESLRSMGSQTDPYSIFLQSLPYNFYPILALVFGLLVASMGRDFGPMLQAERRAHGGKLLADTAVPLSDFDGTALQAPEGKPRRWYNAALPILVVLIVTFSALWISGRVSLRADSSPLADLGLFELGIQGIGGVFGAGNSYNALLYASLAGCLTALGLAVGQRILSLGNALAAWINGVKSMTLAIVILILAWAIADVCSDLNTKGYMVALLSDNLDPRLLPALVFVLASVTAFSTGTSWATMGILIPLAVPTAYELAQTAGFDADTTHRILLGSVSSVLAGAIFGDHCSPISDTTVLSSTASGCDHVDHVRTQLPYALMVGGVAMVLGYLPGGYGVSPFVCLGLAALVLAAGLVWFGKPRRA